VAIYECDSVFQTHYNLCMVPLCWSTFVAHSMLIRKVLSNVLLLSVSFILDGPAPHLSLQ